MAGLTLKIKPEFPIYIGDSIRVRIIKTHAKYARLQIEAPEHVRILRGDAATEDERKEIDANVDAALMASRS